jgi:hypothetical protein
LKDRRGERAELREDTARKKEKKRKKKKSNLRKQIRMAERQRAKGASLTLYKASPWSVTCTTCTLPFMPSATSNRSGIMISGMQRMPAPVWLNSGTRLMGKSVLALSSEPMPRLTMVEDQPRSLSMAREPPVRGQGVRSLVEASRPPPREC